MLFFNQNKVIILRLVEHSSLKRLWGPGDFKIEMNKSLESHGNVYSEYTFALFVSPVTFKWFLKVFI